MFVFVYFFIYDNFSCMWWHNDIRIISKALRGIKMWFMVLLNRGFKTLNIDKWSHLLDRFQNFILMPVIYILNTLILIIIQLWIKLKQWSSYCSAIKSFYLWPLYLFVESWIWRRRRRGWGRWKVFEQKW